MAECELDMVIAMNNTNASLHEDPDELRKALQDVVKYLWPDIDRGPYHSNWVSTMQRIANLLDWETCQECRGSSSCPSCEYCLGIGKVEPESDIPTSFGGHGY